RMCPLVTGKVHHSSGYFQMYKKFKCAVAGYNAPLNLQNYARYLDSRMGAYRDLKHDAVRVQAESNRDMRNNNSIEEDLAYRGELPSSKGAPSRSKTVTGRKLRVMTVEKGLL